MPKPSSNFQYDRFLTGLLMGLQNENTAFGHLAVPTILHDDESGLYPIVSAADMMRIAASERPSGTPAASAGYGMEQGSFKTVRYALKQGVDIDDAAKAKAPVDLDMDAVAYIAHQMQLINESKFAAAAFTTSTWGQTDQTGVTSAPSSNQFVWWGNSTATPGKNVRAMASTIKQSTGKRPNVLFVTDDVDAALQYCPDVIDRIKYTNSNAVNSNAAVNASTLAAYFGVDKYVVCGATNNTAKEGASPTMAFLASNKALLAYVDQQPGMTLQSARWRPTALAAIRYDLPGGMDGHRVRSYFDDTIKSNVVEGDEAFVYHRPSVDSVWNSGRNPLAVLFTSVLS